MGNLLACHGMTIRSHSIRSPSNNRRSASRKSHHSNPFLDLNQNTQEQILAAALVYQQQQNVSPALGRSTSVRPPSAGTNKPLPRSASERHRRSLNDPAIQLKKKDLGIQESNIDDLETKHFVLVHGGGFGAWCWYKTIALLEETGYQVTAIDLAGSGVHSLDPNKISSVAQYMQPLTDLLEKLPGGDKVILVGHDFGGVCTSYAMELFAPKISKAVFIAAIMVTSGQSAIDIFSQSQPNELAQEAKTLLYANGNDNPPTSVDFKRSLMENLLFNKSPAKDISLASVSLRCVPFGPSMEIISLSDLKYGSVRKFYVKTQDDNAIPVAVQEKMISCNPPEKVFHLKGSDHSPFFSKPQALHKILMKIAEQPPLLY